MRTETKFEIGRRYRALGGWIGTVTEISNWDGRLHVTHDRLDMSGKFVLKTSNLPDGRFNYEGCEGEHENDLLLPAIEPEVEVAKKVNRFSDDTFEALARYSAFWTSFVHGIQSGEINPCNGVIWKCHEGGYISCTYLTREAALSEAAEVIRQIDALLET